jgi:hypothetical protein
MSPRTTAFRRGATLGMTAALVAIVLGAIPAGAATTTTNATGVAANEFLNGVIVVPPGATVTTPGSPTRQLSVDQTAAFMRSWLPASTVQQIPNEKPPKCLPVSTIRFKNEFGGLQTATTAWYASDGITAWVGMPKQELGFAVVQSDKWIPAPDAQATIATFNAPGDAPSTTNDCASNTSTTTPTTTVKTTPDDSSSSTTWVWFAVPAAIVVAIGIWLLMRSRSRARAA